MENIPCFIRFYTSKVLIAPDFINRTGVQNVRPPFTKGTSNSFTLKLGNIGYHNNRTISLFKHFFD